MDSLSESSQNSLSTVTSDSDSDLDTISGSDSPDIGRPYSPVHNSDSDSDLDTISGSDLPDIGRPYSPVHNIDVSNIYEDAFVALGEVLDHIHRHSSTSTPRRRRRRSPYNTRSRAQQRNAHRQSEADSDTEGSDSSTTDMTEESSRGSPPREQHVSEEIEPPAKVRKLSSPILNDPEENDGETCPICLDSWGNSGDHRLVALKCGHLFGFKCVDRWIRGKSHKDRSCPTCKTKASIKDIRYIYAKKLAAVDTTELTALQKQVETIQNEKNQIEIELQATKMEHRSLALQMELLRKTLASNSSGTLSSRRNWRFALDKNLEVWKDGGCRVLAYNCRTYEFYVSQKTSNNIFLAYGVRPISCVDYKFGPFIPLHPKAIRDVAYSQQTDFLMSVGLDGGVKIVERGILTKTIQCGMPLWSCAWDYTRPYHFHIGGVGGVVMTYDLRSPNAAMETISMPGDMSPSVSLVSTEFGVLSCQLNTTWLWQNALVASKPQQLPLRGPFVSLCYDEDSKRVAISCRPSNNERAKVALYKVSKSSNGVSCEFEQNMFGSSRSSVMSRAAFVKCPEATWVAAYSESDSALLLHPTDGSRIMSLHAVEAALDVCAGYVNGGTIVAALSDARLRLYKAYTPQVYS